IPGVTLDFARVHVAIGVKHRNHHVPRIAEVENDWHLIQRLTGNEKANRPETAVLFGHEIVAAENPLEREGGLLQVRRIIANPIQFADVFEDSMEHHRTSFMNGKSNQLLTGPVLFGSEDHRRVARSRSGPSLFSRARLSMLSDDSAAYRLSADVSPSADRSERRTTY